MSEREQYFLGTGLRNKSGCSSKLSSLPTRRPPRWTPENRPGFGCPPRATWLLDQIGLSSGARALETGCGPRGCLDLLAARVGPAGSVVAIERNEEAVALARQLVAEKDFAALKEGLRRHIENPDTLVFLGPHVQAWGRKPG